VVIRRIVRQGSKRSTTIAILLQFLSDPGRSFSISTRSAGCSEISRYPQPGGTFGLPVQGALGSIGYLSGLKIDLGFAALIQSIAATLRNTRHPAGAWLEPQHAVCRADSIARS
jgi:hypothetical protein